MIVHGPASRVELADAIDERPLYRHYIRMAKNIPKRGRGRPAKDDGLVSVTVRVTPEQAENLRKNRPNASRIVRKALENAGLGKSE